MNILTTEDARFIDREVPKQLGVSLEILMKNPQIVLTRQVLLEKLWDADGNFVDEHALTAAISRVRNKIETPGRQYIKTVYGMGYMWIGGALK